MSLYLTKASVFLRTIGTSSSSIDIVSSEGSVIDAANLYKLIQGNPNAFFDTELDGYNGNGYVQIGTHSGSVSILWPWLTYPVSFDKAGLYNIAFRVRSSVSSVFDFSIGVNGVEVSSHSVSVSNSWTWVTASVVAADNKTFDLSVIPKTDGIAIDSIYLGKDTPPLSFLYDSSYVTIHMKVYGLDSNLSVGSQYPVYAYKTTISEVIEDNWYNFSLEPMTGHEVFSFDGNYALALFPSGANSNRYVIWDYANPKAPGYLIQDPYNLPCALTINPDTKEWQLDCNNHYAMRLYTSRDAIDHASSNIVVPASALVRRSLNKFDIESTKPSFIQTKIEEIDSETNKVVLSLPDKLVSVIMDQSGSMSWNDSQGLRHTITRKMIDRLHSSYPGEVKYNLLSIGSTPIKINFFAAVENTSLNTSDPNAVASSFFADQESGYAGVRIIRKKNSAPTTPLDGEIIVDGFSERVLSDNLLEDQTYYYAAYTFNSAGIFSDPTILYAKPHPRVVPHGVGSFTARVITGTGVARDSNTIGIWHLNESEGNLAYDFTDDSITLSSSEDIIWLNKEDVPSGVSGVRFNGNSTRFTGYDGENKILKSHYTIMAMVSPFDFNSKRTIFSRELTSGANQTFTFGVNTNGTLFFTMDNVTFVNSTESLQANTWNHVAVVVDVNALAVSFYVDGHFAGSGSVTTGGNYLAGPMNLYIGGRVNSFFGKITELSVHDTIRSSSYILEHSFITDDQSLKVLDNGDRLVLLKYVISDDYNYVGGNVRIVAKESAGPAVFVTESSGTSNPTSKFVGFGSGPSNETDGTVVFEEAASPGSFIIVLPNDYIHDRTYNYRIYSQNTIGNYSLSSDSPTLSIKIPPFSSKEDRIVAVSTPSLESPQNVNIIPGNSKAYITWDSVTDSNVAQIFVYWAGSGYPIINNDQGVDSKAVLVFSGNVSERGFVDRNISNQSIAYYAVVFADRYGNFSEPFYISTTPTEDANEANIPLLTIKNFGYEPVNENALSLFWDAPVKFQKTIKAWFDQRIALFAQITDEYGAPIADVSRISFSAKVNLGSSGLAEDVFGDVINTAIASPDPSSCYVLSSTPSSNGFIRGSFRMTGDIDLLSSISSLSATISVFYSIPDSNNPDSNVFEFTSLPIHIEMQNPFSMQLINSGQDSAYFGEDNSSSFIATTKRGVSDSTSINVSAPSPSGDYVKVLCKQSVPLSDQGFIASGGLLFDPDKFKTFDGCYIRRSKPFVARVVVLYKGQSIGVSNCEVAVFQASDPQCDPDDDASVDPCSQGGGGGGGGNVAFVPGFSSVRSKSVQPPSTSIPLRVGVQQLQNGTNRQVSYADIPLQPPKTPQGVMLFAKSSYNGFYSRKKLYIVFENILRVETTVQVPESDCIDVAEQQANVYLIDPNNPTKSIAIPDSQVIRWDLRKGLNGKDRPFYSTDNVSAGPGVYSYSRAGVAKRVFFGPACNVSWLIYTPCPDNVILLPEIYAIRASIVYDGLTAFEERPAIIYPPGGNQRSFGSRFLMQMPQYVNDVYADGYSLVPLTIYRDPNISNASSASCFIECANNSGSPVFVLDSNQLVDIESSDAYEILYGDSLQLTTDSVINETVVTNANKQIGFAQVPLSSDNATVVYFRINKFIGRPVIDLNVPTDGSQSDEAKNICDCIQLPPGQSKNKTLSGISGRTSVILNGNTVYLSGGGGLENGVPPTLINLIEPLDIIFVDIRRDGKSIKSILCDSISIHEFIVEVTFKGNPVPDGTPIFLQVGGSNPEKASLSSNTIYTKQINDSILNPEGNPRSFASFSVQPFGAESAFDVQIQAETTYDKRGDVARSMKACVSMNYDPSQKPTTEKGVDTTTDTPLGVINSVFSSTIEVFDTFTNTWEVKEPMKNPRGSLTMDWVLDPYQESLFAIGGLDGNSVLAYNEKYDVDTDTWTTKASMKVPRFYHMSIQDLNYIYVFGGITSNGSDLAVTRSVERYNVDTDVWENMPDMPILDQNTYGIAMGASVRIGNKAYFVGGVRKIGAKGSIESMNDRILVFDLDNYTWGVGEQILGSDFDLYQRISPFAFASNDGSKVHIFGGSAVTAVDTDTNQQTLKFVTTSFNFDTYTFEFSQDDYLYDELPLPRYRGGVVEVNGDHYFLGGTSSKSQVSNLFEKLEENGSLFNHSILEDMPTAKTSFGYSSDSSRYIYVVGGLTSGRPAGFLQISANINPSSIRLDGKQSATLSLELRDEVGELPSKSVRVLVQGVLLFPQAQATNTSSQKQSGASAERDALFYPVIFSSNDFSIKNGKGSTILMPRSEDILRKISDINKALGLENSAAIGSGGIENGNLLQIKEGDIRNPYHIKIRVTVIDDFYYGQTVLDVIENQTPIQPAPPPPVVSPPPPPVTAGSPPPPPPPPAVVFQDCRSVDVSQKVAASDDTTNSTTTNNTRDLENNQPIDSTLKDSKNPAFSLNPSKSSQLASPEISYFSDIEWIPQVRVHVNAGSYDDIVSSLNILKNDIPFGASPLYDGIDKSASLMLDSSVHKYSKVIYVNTDNEENLSLVSIENAISDIQAVDGFQKTPTIINNYSVVFPVTLSALAARTDTNKLDTIASSTRGQSQTILDSSFTDEIVNNTLGRVSGSIGWGLYECVIDLGSTSLVNSISVEYDLFSNTDGNWKVATSDDGFVFSEFSDPFDANVEVTLSRVSGRYLKFNVSLLTGFGSEEDAYDSSPSINSPAITGINVEYNVPTESFIYLNTETISHSPQQIDAAIAANTPQLSDIQVGVTTSNSFNWSDYHSGSQNSVGRYGKIFIPIRYKQSQDETLNEPLENIDSYMWKAQYGRWDVSSEIILYDAEDNIVDPSLYKTYPQEGIIVFSSKQSGPLFISIENAGKLRIGVRIINNDANEPISISGLGYMYNTNVFLPPPLAQRPPSAKEFKINPVSPTIYSKMSFSYKYFDLNQRNEDEDKSEIHWFINGTEVDYLKNVREWNDLSNPSDPVWVYGFTFKPSDVPDGTSIEQFARQRQESILHVGDSVYATIRVSDGLLLSDQARATPVIVVSAPPFVTSVTIKGKNNDGTIQDSVTIATRAIAVYSFFQDENSDSKSKITWFVNGIQFKTGDLGGLVNGLSNDEILVGEIANNIVGLATGNILQVQIIPASDTIVGVPVSSDAISVQSEPPSVNSVLITPNPTAPAASSLSLSYTFVSTGNTQQGAAQRDQSSIKWFRASDSGSFAEVTSLQNQKVVASVNIAVGDQWKAEVTPFDGVTVGKTVSSDPVTII